MIENFPKCKWVNWRYYDKLCYYTSTKSNKIAILLLFEL